MKFNHPGFECPNADLAIRVTQALRRAGHDALLVGGCVRDLLLGRHPDDFDVATDAVPDQVMALFPRTVPVGAQFGVVLVVEDDAQVEVATFRTDGGYADRRRPDSVCFSDARHDAERRDFTINAMFLDPDTGLIVDFAEGESDIAAKLIRSVGDPRRRFSEDALRLLRAVRFASSLGFHIEPVTWVALCELAGTITAVSSERIRDELSKGLTRANPGLFLRLLDSSGLLDILLPEVAALKGCDQPPQFHPEGDVFAHTRLMLDHLPEDRSPALAFAALLHDVGKPPTREVLDRIRFNNHSKVGADIADSICRRLAMSNELREGVVEMVRRHMDFMNLTRMRRSTLRRFLAGPHIRDEIELHRADCIASHGNTENCDYAVRHLEEFAALTPTGGLPPPLVNGEDLIAMGMKPGPRFAVLLREVQDAQLEGRITDREQALYLLGTLARVPG